MPNIKSITVELEDGRKFETVQYHGRGPCVKCALTRYCTTHGYGELCTELAKFCGEDTIFKEVKDNA